MKRTYEGPPAGTGAVYAWNGNDKVGAGRMTLTGSRPGERITIKLDFLRPFASTNVTEFIFTLEGGRTVVTWTMVGRKNLVGKAFGLFANKDKMIGGDFEKGLVNLRSVSEAAARM